MSFSTEIKNEVTKLDSTKLELISELSAIVRNSAIIEDSIKITIENNSVARRIFKLFRTIYDITPIITVRNRYFNKGISYILEIKEKNNTILQDLSIYDENNNYLSIPREYIISDEDELRAYLRGLFISVGSLNDPKTSRYHLEFLLDTSMYAKFISKLLNEYDLNSKIIKREKKYMVYIKEAEKISDFLRIIKAYNAVMYYEDIRIYRDHKNMTNRLNNCEQANMDRVIKTALEQVKQIETIISKGGLELLDEKEQLVANYRMKYKDVSLEELSEIISFETNNKITKSGLYHRFKKIKDLANKLSS